MPEFDTEQKEWLIKWLLDEAYRFDKESRQLLTKAQTMRELAIEVRARPCKQAKGIQSSE